jgi:hypothetical protein
LKHTSRHTKSKSRYFVVHMWDLCLDISINLHVCTFLQATSESERPSTKLFLE